MEEMDREFTEFFSSIWKFYGLGDLPSKMVGILYLEPEEITMEDLAKKTGYSLSSISNTMKLLENIGVIQRIKKPKTKKIFFYMEKDLAKLNKQKLRAAQDNVIKPIKEFMPPLIKKYRHKVKDAESRKKLRIMENYHKQILDWEGILQHMMEELDKLST